MIILAGLASALFLLIFFFITHLLLNRWKIEVALPVGVLFWIADVLWNYTYGSLFFLQLPPVIEGDWTYRPTLTARVYYNYVNKKGWRQKLAAFSKRVIEMVDKEHFK